MADRMAGAMSKPCGLAPLGQKCPCLSLAGYQRPVSAGPPPRLWEEAVPEDPPLIYPLPSGHLRLAAVRLAGQLDSAKLHQAAAYVSMAVDSMPSDGPRGANDDRLRSEAECEFELDDYDRVWMHLDGDCQIIGRRDYIRTEMWRFIRVMLAKPF